MSAHEEIEYMKTRMVDLETDVEKTRHLGWKYGELANRTVLAMLNELEGKLNVLSSAEKARLQQPQANFEALSSRIADLNESLETFKREANYRLTEHTKQLLLVKGERAEVRELWTGLSTRVHVLENGGWPWRVRLSRGLNRVSCVLYDLARRWEV